MKRFIAQIDENDYEWLKKYAASRNSSVSKIVRDLITACKDKDDRKKSPKQY
jgi:hypothetical protein